jgi:hypothetical protein
LPKAQVVRAEEIAMNRAAFQALVAEHLDEQAQQNDRHAP